VKRPDGGEHVAAGSQVRGDVKAFGAQTRAECRAGELMVIDDMIRVCLGPLAMLTVQGRISSRSSVGPSCSRPHTASTAAMLAK